jgi:hypothetical protein
MMTYKLINDVRTGANGLWGNNPPSVGDLIFLFVIAGGFLAFGVWNAIAVVKRVRRG